MAATYYYLCLGCGAWQSLQQTSEQACGQCGSKRLCNIQNVGMIPGSESKVRADIARALVDVEFHSDGAIEVSRLYTDRLVHIRQGVELLGKLSVVAKECLKNGLDGHAWLGLRVRARGLLFDELNSFLEHHSLGHHSDSKMDVDVSFRLLNLNPEMSDVEVGHSWVEVVSLHDASSIAARELDRGKLDVDLHGSLPSLGEGGECLRISVSSPFAAFVEETTLASKDDPDRPLEEKVKSWVFLRRNVKTALLDLRLSAKTLRSLASKPSDSPNRAELHVRIHGKDEAISIDIPCGDLGDPGRMVDAFLDIGSTTTKYIFRVGQLLEEPAVRGTKKLIEEWSLPPYMKARFLEDATGEEWAKWVSCLLVALRRHVGSKLGGYLRSVYLTLPQSSGGLDVSGLNASLAAEILIQRSLALYRDASGMDTIPASSSSSKSTSIDALQRHVERETVGQVEGVQALVLVSEHQAVAKFYLEPLKALYQIARSYQEYRDEQKAKQSDWYVRYLAKSEYNAKSFLGRLFTTTPDGPSGSIPGVPSPLPDWMRKLIESPEKLERVVLLDAGGLSLDMAVLESGELVAEYSKSDITSGGERVSIELGKRLGWQDTSSENATDEKAALGQVWARFAGGTDIPLDQRFVQCGNGRSHKAYREVTRHVYKDAIKELASSVTSRWESCTVILTGGGSRNPHLQEFVFECMEQAGIEADVVDAQILQEFVNEASSFSTPLPGLGALPIALFTTIHGLALKELSGGSRHLAYDKYAVVGGMLAMAGMQGA